MELNRPEISKFTRVVLVSALAVAAACTGRGSEISSCNDDGTPIKVTFAGSPDYEKSLDPAVLANYANSRPYKSPDDPGNDWGYDKLDEIGEVACESAKGKVALTGPGAQLSQLYIEAHPESNQPT